jgi:hypothetical protein
MFSPVWFMYHVKKSGGVQPTFLGLWRGFPANVKRCLLRQRFAK